MSNERPRPKTGHAVIIALFVATMCIFLFVVGIITYRTYYSPTATKLHPKYSEAIELSNIDQFIDVDKFRIAVRRSFKDITSEEFDSGVQVKVCILIKSNIIYIELKDGELIKVGSY